MLTLTDEELVARCKSELPNNTYSYERLVERHMDGVYRLVYRIVGNREEAEDIAQEVFLKVYNSIKKYEQQAAFTSWLYRIATNAGLDALDKTKRRPQAAVAAPNQSNPQEETDLLSQQPSTLEGPEDSLIRQELRECINRVLKKLKTDQARLIMLRDYNDLSYDEIARLLNAGLSATKMQIHRARLSFQDVFGQMCGKIYLTFGVNSKTKKHETQKEKQL